ncbi:MAG: sigma-70 family RNA polymerase sigma factor [Clostridia bacterium]|nr:sigma-70 family RNA polymerase sigma factor [Clostridia bacterium]
MEDHRIVDLYWARNESAITESDRKYGKLLKSISYSLLSSYEDAEECVNDTYLDAWRAMPTARPAYLGAFLSKLARRISIDRWRREHREKRGGADNLMEELSECIPAESTVETEYENGRLTEALNRFLYGLDAEKRTIFLQRYFYSQPIATVAASLNISEAKVKVVLHRVREQLRHYLEEQDLL